MPKVTFVKKARKDIPGSNIKKGDSYFWFKFRFGPKYCSKTRPNRSQLTQSAFLSAWYDFEDEVNAMAGIDEDGVQELIGRAEEMRDECQSSLDNMPEQLQESSDSGNTLRERIDELDNFISELETIDFSMVKTEDELEELKEAGEETSDYQTNEDTIQTIADAMPSF